MLEGYEIMAAVLLRNGIVNQVTAALTSLLSPWPRQHGRMQLS